MRVKSFSKIVVVRLGCVGLPLVVEFAKKVSEVEAIADEIKKLANV